MEISKEAILCNIVHAVQIKASAGEQMTDYFQYYVPSPGGVCTHN